MTDDLERPSYLPWLMGVLILVISAAKLDAARPTLATVLAVAVPVVPVVMGVYRLQGSGEDLERAALAVGGITVLAGELCVARGFFGVGALEAVLVPARFALYGAATASLAVHVLAVRRGMNRYFSAFLGIASVFAVYLSAHPGKDAFSGVFGAFFVALFVGGGVGLVAGEVLGRAFKEPR